MFLGSPVQEAGLWLHDLHSSYFTSIYYIIWQVTLQMKLSSRTLRWGDYPGLCSQSQWNQIAFENGRERQNSQIDVIKEEEGEILSMGGTHPSVAGFVHEGSRQ